MGVLKDIRDILRELLAETENGSHTDLLDDAYREALKHRPNRTKIKSAIRRLRNTALADYPKYLHLVEMLPLLAPAGPGEGPPPARRRKRKAAKRKPARRRKKAPRRKVRRKAKRRKVRRKVRRKGARKKARSRKKKR